MSAPDADSLVILLHGVGATGRDLAPLGSGLTPALPNTTFVAPDAPFSFDQGPGWQWFSLDGITAADRPQRVAAARSAFDFLLTGVIDTHGLTNRLDRVALVGFSQGAIMALDAVASGRWPVGAVVGFSGRLASPLPLEPAKQTPVLVVHGADDPVIVPEETEHAATVLAGLGVSVESHILAGVGHVVAPEGLSLAAQFLARTLGPLS